VPSGLDHGQSRWGPIVGFVLVASANQMAWLNFAPITTGAAARLGVSQSAIGWLSEMFPLLYVLLAIPIGVVLDRWFRSTLAAGAVLTAGGSALRVAGHGYGPIVAGQLLIAFAQPAVLNAITGTATRYLSEGHRPVGIAVESAGTFLGFIFAFLLGAAFGAEHLHAILVISAIYAVASLAVLVVAIRGPVRELAIMQGGDDGVGAAAPSRIRQLWGDRVLRNLSALVFLGFGTFIALTTWVETLLKPAGVSSGTTDTLLTVMVVAGVVGSVVIPPVAASRSVQAQAVIVSAVAITGCCLLLAVAPGVVAASISLSIIGLLLLPDLPVILELAERRAGPAGGTATATLWLAGNAGGIVVALILQGLQSAPAAAFAVLAVAGLLALPLCVLLRSQLHRELLR
jgi:predicted MFS family arabinose efflux permease